MGNNSTILFLFDNSDDEESSQLISKILDIECKNMGIGEKIFEEQKIPPHVLQRIKNYLLKAD